MGARNRYLPPGAAMAALLLLAALVASDVHAGEPERRDSPTPTPTPTTADRAPDFFDGEHFRLVRAEGSTRLRSVDGLEVEVPAEWLRPPEVVEEERSRYVSSLDWEEEVSAFPVGGGRLGLHLSSYRIADGGSAAAAAGADLFLILDPATGALHRGLDLRDSKGRVRLGACFAAWFHRVEAGDVNCDRRLDLAVVEERMSCEPTESRAGEGEEEEGVTLEEPHHRISPRGWHVQEGDRWVYRESYDDRLPCAGLRDLPLVGIVLTPVEFALHRYRSEPPLRRDSGGWLTSIDDALAPPEGQAPAGEADGNGTDGREPDGR